jgi:hypothetical protein
LLDLVPYSFIFHIFYIGLSILLIFAWDDDPKLILGLCQPRFYHRTQREEVLQAKFRKLIESISLSLGRESKQEARFFRTNSHGILGEKNPHFFWFPRKTILVDL